MATTRSQSARAAFQAKLAKQNRISRSSRSRSPSPSNNRRASISLNVTRRVTRSCRLLRSSSPMRGLL